MKKPTDKDLEKWINKQFEIAGHDVTYNDVKGEPEDIENPWYTKYTITVEQEKVFREYLEKEIKPFVYSGRIQKEIGRFVLSFGLRTVRK